MAITTTIRIEKTANKGIPTSYVPATLPTLTDKKTQKHSTQLAVATIENASETTALANLATDLQTYLTNTFFDDVMHFDTADTIAANITVTKIERTRTESNDLKPGSEVYEIDFTLDWNY